MANRVIMFLLTAVPLFGALPPAHAQFAVIDVASLTQLISQLQTLEQQVETARSQLSQAQSEYQSITGARGMEQLLGGTVRNYLPGNWVTLQSSLQGGPGGYRALAASVQSAVQLDSVLSAERLAGLSPQVRAQLQTGRDSAALLQGVTHEALANSSGRFAAIQQLIDAIARANDQKGILDLQARIAAETGMLQNEQTKMQVLYEGVRADQSANAQRLRELAVVGHGQFDLRFQPKP
jgi:type IV secretion system protein VirB5